MFKFNIKNKISSMITNQATFATKELGLQWIENCEKQNVFGLPDRWVLDSPFDPLSDEEKEKAVDTRVVDLEDGTQATEYFFEAEYTVEIEDITEDIKYEKEVAKRVARINFGTKLFAEFAARNVARLKAGTTTIETLLAAEEKLSRVHRLMSNSSTEMALQGLIALDIPEIPNDEKALFISKIQQYLATEK